MNAIEEGRSDEFREIILPPGKDPARVDRLIDLVMKQGVEVARASEPFGNVVEDYHGGRIWVEDNPDRRGTCFAIRLPAAG